MQSKSSLKFPVVIGSAAGLAFSALVISFFIFGSASSADGQAPFTPSENVIVSIGETQGLPVRLTIPAIGVDAAVEYVGLDSEGAMDVPKRQGNVGWFQLGPRPGEPGAAVIAGHYGRKNGEASVFDELYKLREGDAIYVRDDKGASIPFFVREIRRYNPDTDASEVFTSTDGKPHLNLITCEGAWDSIRESYPYRLVIFTDKEMESITETVAIDGR